MRIAYVPGKKKPIFQGMPLDVMPMMEKFANVTAREKLIKQHGSLPEEKPAGSTQLPGGEREEEKEKSVDQSEPDHDFWAHDADWHEYRTHNTQVQGYHDPNDDEFSFYKKEKGPEEGKTEEWNESGYEEWKEARWY